MQKGVFYMERVFEIIQEQLHLSDVAVTEDLSFQDDLGADSVDLMELVMALEDEYGVELSYEDNDKRMRTVGDVVEYLRELGADV